MPDISSNLNIGQLRAARTELRPSTQSPSTNSLSTASTASTSSSEAENQGVHMLPTLAENSASFDLIDIKELFGSDTGQTSIPNDKLDTMNSQWGTAVTYVLLMTPLVQEKMLNGTEFTDADYNKLSSTAAQLALVNAGNNMPIIQMQEIANLELGDTLNFSEWSTLSNTLTSVIDQLDNNLKDMGNQQPLGKVISGIKEKLESLGNSPDIATLHALHDDLHTAANALPKSTQSFDVPVKHDTLLLASQVRHNELQLIKSETKAQLKEQMKDFTNPGTERELHVRLGIGAGAGKSAGFKLLGGQLDLDYKFRVKVHDDGRIRPAHYITPKLKMTIGNKKTIQGVVSAAYEQKLAAKSIPSLDAFIEVFATDLLTRASFVLPLSNTSKVRSAFFQSAKQEHRAMASNEQLASLLANQDIIPKGTTIKMNQSELPAYTFSRFHTNGAKGTKLEAGFNAANNIVNGAISRSQVINTYNKRVNLMPAMKTYANLVDLQKQSYFSFNFSNNSSGAILGTDTANNSKVLKRGAKAKPQLDNAVVHFKGQEGYQKLNELDGVIGKLIDVLKNDTTLSKADRNEKIQNLDTIRTQVKQSIFDLYGEFRDYSHTVNEYDGRLNKQIHLKPAQGYKACRSTKHAMEKGRGASGRGEFIRAVITTHTKLHSLYEKTFQEGSTPAVEDADFNNLLNHIESEYEMPQMHLESRKHIHKHLNAVTSGNSIHTNITSLLNVNTGIEDIVGVSFSPEIIYQRVENYNNTDNDGEYITARIKLTAGTNLQSVLTKIDPRLFLPGSDQSTEFRDFDWSNFNYSIDMEGILELRFHKHEKVDSRIAADDKPHWDLMYVRGLSGLSAGAFVSTAAPVGGIDVAAKAGAKIRSRNHVGETFGTNSLRYMQTKFNGWHGPNKTGFDQTDANSDDYWGPYKKTA